MLVAPLLEYQEYTDHECRSLNAKIEKHRGTDRATELRETRDFFLANGLVAFTTIVWGKLAEALKHLDLFQTGSFEPVSEEAAEADSVLCGILEGTRELRV